MNNKRIYTALGALFVTASMAFAQHMLIVDKGGYLKALKTSEIGHTTFTSDREWFEIKNNDIEDIGENLFSASCNVSLGDGIKSIGNGIEVGVCYSKDTETPTIYDHSMSIGTELKDYTFKISPVAPGTTYYYRVYVKFRSDVFYGDVAKVTTFGTAPVDNSKIINGHKFVDLGLPSGILWAETNIGAESAVDDGKYFAWGETTTKLTYSKDRYRLGYDGVYYYYKKYNYDDGKTVLEPNDDAAYVNWGDSCRMPTSDEFEELINSCTWTLTYKPTSDVKTTIKGYEILSNTNGNSIFLPASGFYYHDSLLERGLSGLYWSSALFSSSDNVSTSYALKFNSGHHDVICTGRWKGFSVRPVAEP